MRMKLPSWKQPGHGVRHRDSLVVATYHRPDSVIALLEHVARLPDCPGEVVVVDVSDEAPIAGWARQQVLPYDLVYVRSPAGLTRQRNAGIDASHGSPVFFLDDDCFPEPGYFDAVRAAFDDGVGAVAGTLVNEMDQPLSRRWRARFALGLVPRGGEPGRYYPTATSVPRAMMKPFHGVRPTDLFPGAAFACRRAVFDRERFSCFFNGYSQGEDLEMAMRIGRNWRIVWAGDARAEHRTHPSGRPGSFHKGMMEVRNRYFIWRRHTREPGLRCRCTLWLDFLFIFGCDLARGHLAHAGGVGYGGLSCLLRPPRFDEPPARKEYEFDHG